MPKIAIIGGAVVITSDILAKALNTVTRANPDALNLLDKNENPIFNVSFRKGAEAGSAGNAGIVFNGTDADGFLRATLPIKDDNAAAKKAEVEEKLLAPMTKLAALTNQILLAAADVETATQQIFGTMEVS